MKNREKFREEIVKCARATAGDGAIRACEFTRRNVLPTFGDGVRCYSINCAWCRFLVDLWLDEEYEEPPKPDVDWNNVPVDTLVRVQYDKSNKWFLRYFKEYEHGAVAPYVTWVSGTTSATSGGLEEHWKYCELVEEKDNE